ncbi:putative Mannose-6-phosphate isomerase [Candidatus Sulfopaludibacter sp. SbA6]|nr:putative Mannose-6-phosphate isomerase [Candidatus Sulfopaludibacter sp. SbA6]
MGLTDTLASRLTYRPQELRFGTSGRRGLVADLTQLEVYTNVLGELQYLQSLSPEAGGVVRGDEFYFAYDLRPSSTAFVPGENRRGEICQAVERGLKDAGMRPVNLGAIPTPALAYYAFSRAKGSIMVTGSHIPFDRNGYKLNTSRGELLKEHEDPINLAVRKVRERLEAQAFGESLFDETGMFKEGHLDLGPVLDDASAAYVRRYETFFEGCSLAGKCIVVYQHSAVGRDLLVEILEHFGAEAIPAGRSSTFVPIDTENIGAPQLARIQELADQAGVGKKIDAVVSMDGDSDRPLLVGVETGTGKARFFGGDLVGMIAAQYLGADSVVVPISCNDGIDRCELSKVVEPKTRIGSPYVIRGMRAAREKGRRAVCGWEANGGFLTGSDIARNGRVLEALPTRDAVLPLLCALFAAAGKNVSIVELFAWLPARYSRAALLEQFPRAIGARLVESYTPENAAIRDVRFAGEEASASAEDGSGIELYAEAARQIGAIRQKLELFFSPVGSGRITHLNYTDGVRMEFGNGDIAHFRPSGNADEFRIYAVADTQERADFIAEAATGSDGVLRRMASG